MGWTYNLASIFFNFGVSGATAGEQTYYFDDVQFGDPFAGINDLNISDITVHPNPSEGQWTILSENTPINQVEVLNLQGEIVYQTSGNQHTVVIDASTLHSGVYIARVTTEAGRGVVRMIKK